MHVDRIDKAPMRHGLAGTSQTLAEMARLVRDGAGSLYLRQKALSIVGACAGHDFQCEIDALFRYCRDEITYRRDPVEVEWVQDAARTVGVFGSGDCDDKVVCLATLLACLGHRSRFVVIGSTPNKFTHVYLEVETKGGWLPLDPTPEQAEAGWEARSKQRNVYEIWPADSNNGLWLVAAGAVLWWITR